MLTSTIRRMQAQRVIAFGASAVQAVFTAPFFTSFGMTVYIEGTMVDDSHFAFMLDSANSLNRHSSVFLFAREKKDQCKLHGKEFTWGHRTIHPYGNVLPLQCPSCGRIYSFDIKASHDGKEHVRCKGQGCSYHEVYGKVPGLRVIKGAEQGVWLMCRL